MQSSSCTTEEENLFCKILVDPVNNFMTALKRKALKKAATGEVFEKISGVFQEALPVNRVYRKENKHHLKGKKLIKK